MHRLLPLSLAAAALATSLAAQAPGADAPRTYDLSEVGTLPRVLNAEEFRSALAESYPEGLRGSGMEGTVTVAFVIDADGVVRDAGVVDSPHPEFGAASVAAVQRLRFEPATVGSAAVAVRVTQPVEWRSPVPPVAVAAEEPEEAADSELAAMIDAAIELREATTLPRTTNERRFADALARTYPAALRNAGRGGSVIVRFIVGVDGRTYEARALTATHPAFIEPALRALEHLRFQPGEKDGVVVPVWVQQPIVWTAQHARSSEAHDRRDGGTRAPRLRIPESAPPSGPSVERVPPQ